MRSELWEKGSCGIPGLSAAPDGTGSKRFNAAERSARQ